MRPHRFSIVWALLFLCLSPLASAQDDKAQKLFSEAELYFKASKFEKAADLYTEAFVASQIPDLLFNVAQCYRNLKKYEETLKTFKQYMMLVSATDEVLAENTDGLRRIQALLPELEQENDFPKKNTTVKKLMKDSKDLAATLVNKAAALPKPSALSISGTKEATVFLDDVKLEGKTPLDILKAKKGSHKLSVTKEGHFPWSKTFEVDGAGKPISFLVELTPIILEVQGTLGADVIINGELKGKIPFRAEGIKAGAYKVSVRLTGHKDWSGDVILPGSSQAPVALEAELIPLVLKVEGPEDAELSIDGDLQGKLPATVEKISLGKHKLTVKKSGFADWSKEIVVTNEKVLYEEKATLTPQTKKVTEPPTTPDGGPQNVVPMALYGVAAVSGGLGITALVGSTRARDEAISLLDLNEPSLLDLVSALDKQSRQLGAASVAAFVVTIGASAGGVLLMNKKPKNQTALHLTLTPSGVALTGGF